MVREFCPLINGTCRNEECVLWGGASDIELCDLGVAVHSVGVFPQIHSTLDGLVEAVKDLTRAVRKR